MVWASGEYQEQELHRLMRAIYVATVKADVSKVSDFPDIIKPQF